MTLAELANGGEALGGLAVVVSLVYLIFELRRNTRTARSDSAWNADISFAQLNLALSQNAQLSELCMRALRADAKLDDFSDAEFAQLFFVCRSCFQTNQAQWNLWREGSLSNEMWENRRRWMRAFISMPVVGRAWELEIGQHQYLPAFVSEINSATLAGDLEIRA